MSAKKRAMPKWTKAPESLVTRFADAIERLPTVEARKMFGYPAAFVNGNMFAGLFQSSMMVRLSEDDRRRLRASPFEPMPGRPMREYVVVPEEVLGSSTTLDEWLRKGHAFASSLPPKAAKKTARSRPRKRP
jgi:TfoX/Sxy family transcriptional regulator of competence genes